MNNNIEDLVNYLERALNTFKKNIRITSEDDEIINEINEHAIGKCARTVEGFILKCRELLLTSPHPKEVIDDFDKKLSESLNIKISKEFYSDDTNFFVYKIDIPFIIPSKKHIFSNEIVRIAIDYAKHKYEEENNVSIIPIGYPSIILENQKSNDTDLDNKQLKYLKDIDNYQIRPFINVFQNIFYGDDRLIQTSTCINKNNCKETKSTFHILPRKFLLDYLPLVL